MTTELIGRTVTGIMVVCALTVTALLVRRELFGVPTPSSILVSSKVKDWKTFERGHVLGPARGSISMVVFSDYQCPACRVFATALAHVVAEYPNALTVRYRHMPLEIHPHARAAAFAASCAETAGRFTQLHDAMFAHPESLGTRSWGRFAALAAVPDTVAFVKCVRDSATVATIAEDERDATRIGARGTPTILLNDRLFHGAIPQDSLKVMIGKLLREGSM